MADERRMFRYEIPVDGSEHVMSLCGTPLAIAAVPGRPDVVEFWAEFTGAQWAGRRTFQVFGTGQLIPEDARWVATAPRTPEGLVWHLYEIGWGSP